MVDTIDISNECSWRIGKGISIVHTNAASVFFAYQIGKGSTR